MALDTPSARGPVPRARRRDLARLDPRRGARHSDARRRGAAECSRSPTARRSSSTPSTAGSTSIPRRQSSPRRSARRAQRAAERAADLEAAQRSRASTRRRGAHHREREPGLRWTRRAPRCATAPKAAGCCAPSSSSSTAARRPTEDEQARRIRAHRRRARGQAARRSARMDIGGDKPIAYLPMPREDNPALGLARRAREPVAPRAAAHAARARSCACSPHGQCRMLLPMVNDLAELRTVRAIAAECARELGRATLPAHRRDDRDTRRRRAGRPARGRSRFPLHRHQRPLAVHARDRPRPCRARRQARCAASGGAAHDPRGRHGRAARTARPSRCAAPWAPTWTRCRSSSASACTRSRPRRR